MLQIDSACYFTFSNVIYFVAFLAEVINQTLLAAKTNKEMDSYQIISDSAEKQMGVLINVEQLKSLTKWRSIFYSEITDLFVTKF